MVVPTCAAHDWAKLLTGIPIFLPGSSPMLVVAPHPDDETLSVGGLIRAQRDLGIPVAIAAVTDGENAYAGRAGSASPHNAGHTSRLGDIRSREQVEAAACLGVEGKDLLRLRMTDSAVSRELPILVERLAPLVSSDTHILAPWPQDFHPDHEACGSAARELALQTGARLTYYFFWTWHRATPALLEGLELHAFPLDATQQAAKAAALACHASQLDDPSGDPILNEIHLWPARLPFEVYLPA